MNRKVCVLCIFLYVFMLFESLYSKENITPVYSLVGILILTLSLVVDIKRSRHQQTEKREIPYLNFAFLYFILGRQIENLVIYIDKQYSIGIIGYTEGAIAFAILAICEYIRFMFPGLIKSKLKGLYYLIFGIEVVKIVIFLVIACMK